MASSPSAPTPAGGLLALLPPKQRRKIGLAVALGAAAYAAHAYKQQQRRQGRQRSADQRRGNSKEAGGGQRRRGAGGGKALKQLLPLLLRVAGRKVLVIALLAVARTALSNRLARLQGFLFRAAFLRRVPLFARNLAGAPVWKWAEDGGQDSVGWAAPLGPRIAALPATDSPTSGRWCVSTAIAARPAVWALLPPGVTPCPALAAAALALGSVEWALGACEPAGLPELQPGVAAHPLPPPSPLAPCWRRGGGQAPPAPHWPQSPRPTVRRAALGSSFYPRQPTSRQRARLNDRGSPSPPPAGPQRAGRAPPAVPRHRGALRMDGGYDKLQGGGEGLGGFMALLTDAPPPQTAPPQRLGSLAQPGPGERGSGAAAPSAAGLTPAALQQQQHLQQQQQQQQQQLYAAPQAAALPGGFAGPAGGIPQQPLAGVNPGLYGGYARQAPGSLGSLGLGGSMPTLVQQPNGGALPYAVPGGSLGAQGEPPAKRQAIDPFGQYALQPQQQYVQPSLGVGLAPAQQQNYNGLLAQLTQGQRQGVSLATLPAGYASLPGQPLAAHSQQLAVQQAAQVQAYAMRVAVDNKGRAEEYDHKFEAEDTTAKDHADEVMRRCEEVTQMLRKTLGKHTEGDRFGATNSEGEVEYHQVEQPQMIEACGDTARYLKPYQLVGINFLLLLYRSKVSGAILADEMGLGKTAQLITYLGCIRLLESDPGPHLVVVPASLLENWQRELRRWCPALKVVVYYGKHRAVVRKRLNTLREKLAKGEEVDDDLADLADPDLLAEAAASHKLAEAAAAAEAEEAGIDDDPYGAGAVHESDDEFDIDKERAGEDADLVPEEKPPEWDIDMSVQAAPFNVMLTCYTLFERDSPEQRLDRGFLEKWRWSHLIMDEAHALKNRNASRTTRLRRIANASRRRIMMTGTPLQNDLAELQNLLHFLLPTVFAAQGFEDLAEMLQGDDEEIAKLTERMKSLLGPFVLRRLKQEVAGQLTEKTHATEFIEMTEEQAGLYAASVARMRSQITGKAYAAAQDNSQKGVEKFLRALGAKKISHMFTHLRKIAQHPLLVRSQFSDDQVAVLARMAYERALFGGAATEKRVREELMNYSDFSLHAFCYNAGPDFASFRLNQSHMMASAKFRFLAKLLKELKAVGSRPLIFSQWTAVLDIMEWLMEVLQLPYVRLDGSTAVDARLATVDRFNHNDDVFAFLLSTRAGGQGLNLTGADTVILHDVDFNPQIDRQAEDRCHRLGQTRPVKVYRLITKGTVDQNIYNLSQRKLRMDSAVLDGITSGKGGKADESAQMGFILHSLIMSSEHAEGDKANGAAV